MQIGLKIWQDFRDHFSQSYRRYHIHRKETAAAHGYGAVENHTQETDDRVNTVDALQSLVFSAIEEK